MEHNKHTVIKEYCLARGIPFRFSRGCLLLGKNRVVSCFSVEDTDWDDIIPCINRMIQFDSDGQFVKIQFDKQK